MPKINFLDVIKAAPMIIDTVKGVQGAFGNKSGKERKQHAEDALMAGFGITEILRDESISDEMKDRAAMLLSRSIELGVLVMKTEREIDAIWAEIQAIRATSRN